MVLTEKCNRLSHASMAIFSLSATLQDQKYWVGAL